MINKNVKLTKLTMLDDFEVQGIWWLPGKEDKELPGNLYSDKGKIYLDLLGNFTDPFQDVSNYEYIYGFTVRGEEITLIRNIPINKSFSSPGLASERILVNFFIVGGHISDINQIKFKSATIVTTYLTRWFNTRIWEKSKDNQNLSDSFSVTFFPPEIKSFYVSSIDSEIKNSYIISRKYDNYMDLSFPYSEFFIVIPTEWKNFDWYEEIASGLNRLLTLLINKTTYLEKIVLLGDYEDVDKTEGIKIRKQYHLFYSNRDIQVNEKLHPHEMLFTYRDIKENLKDILNNWFEKKSYLKNVYDLYFSDFFNRHSDLETKFLNAIQSLEVYHRSLGYGKLFDDKEKNKYLEIIEESIDGKVTDEIKGLIIHKLKHFNEYSLQNRLKDIKNSLSDSTILFLFDTNRNAKSYIYKAVNTRNFLTHYEEKGNEKKFKGIELFYATNLLKVLSGVLLFKELGIEENVIVKSIKNNPRLLQIINNSKSSLF